MKKNYIKSNEIMRNQPKYHFFKNTSYALNGLKDLVLSERSFQLELAVAAMLLPLLIWLDLEPMTKLIMFMSLMGVLIAEAINSAIERAVDLVTLEHHLLAKRAKDMGSAVVFLTIATCLIVWVVAIGAYYA